jgi:hypothetical protein
MNKLLTTLLLTIPMVSPASVDLEPVKTLNVDCVYLDRDGEGRTTGNAFSFKGKVDSLQEVPEEVVVMYNDTELVIKVHSCDVEMK